MNRTPSFLHCAIRAGLSFVAVAMLLTNVLVSQNLRADSTTVLPTTLMTVHAVTTTPKIIIALSTSSKSASSGAHMTVLPLAPRNAISAEKIQHIVIVNTATDRSVTHAAASSSHTIRTVTVQDAGMTDAHGAANKSNAISLFAPRAPGTTALSQVTPSILNLMYGAFSSTLHSFTNVVRIPLR